MTMTGNSTNKDVVGPLVDDSLPPKAPNALQQAFQAIANLIIPTQKELITQLRAPTPLKVSKIFTISATGTIGGGVGNPSLDQVIYTAPVSAEVWIHRITLTSPENTPSNPIQPTLQSTNVGMSNPAAGAQFNGTPFAKSATVVSIQFTLTTSATVANRLVQVVIGGNTFAAAVAQTASLVETYNFYPGAPATTVLPATGGQIFTPIPSIIVPTGSNIFSNVTGLQAGDTLTAITYVIQNFGANPPELSIIGTTSGEVILTLPEYSTTSWVIPNQFVEGRLSAPHLDRGESICLNGDGLPAGNHIRVDLQVVILTGASEFTPRSMSPSDLMASAGTRIE